MLLNTMDSDSMTTSFIHANYLKVLNEIMIEDNSIIIIGNETFYGYELKEALYNVRYQPSAGTNSAEYQELQTEIENMKAKIKQFEKWLEV
jgi:hypothetical protein